MDNRTLFSRNILYLFILLITLWVQGGIISQLISNLTGSNVQVVIILVVFLAFDFRNIGDIWLAFVFGMALDMLSGILIGPWSAATVSVYTFCCFISRRVFIDNILVLMGVTFISILLGSSVNQLLIAHAPRMEQFEMVVFIKKLLQEAFLSAIVAPIIFFFFRLIFKSSLEKIFSIQSRSSKF